MRRETPAQRVFKDNKEPQVRRGPPVQLGFKVLLAYLEELETRAPLAQRVTPAIQVALVQLDARVQPVKRVHKETPVLRVFRV